MKSYKRYLHQSNSNINNNINNDNVNDDEIVEILSKMNYNIDSSPNSSYGKTINSIYYDNSSSSSINTDNDDNTIVTINSYNSNNSHSRSSSINRSTAVNLIRQKDYRGAVELLDIAINNNDDDDDYKLLYYRSICYSNMNMHNNAYDDTINIINSNDKYPPVTVLLQLAKCQSNLKMYKDAIITLLRAHQENERQLMLSNIDNDNCSFGNQKIKINDMIRKTKLEMKEYQAKNDPIAKYSLPIIEYNKKLRHSNGHTNSISRINSNSNSPMTIESVGSQSSPNTTVSSISYDAYDSEYQTYNPQTSSKTGATNRTSKNRLSRDKKNKTKIVLPPVKPKIKSQFPKYKPGLTLRAVIEKEKERKQEIFKMNQKASEKISFFVNLLGSI